MNINEIFAKRIKEAISDSQYTQKQIAEILHISEGNISNWKRGTHLPSVDILHRLCLLLDVTSDYLLGLEDELGAKIVVSNSYNSFGNNNNITF